MVKLTYPYPERLNLTLTPIFKKIGIYEDVDWKTAFGKSL